MDLDRVLTLILGIYRAYFDRFRGKGEWYDTGDAGVIDEVGYVSVLSRADDLINVAGHRLGTSLLEQGQFCLSSLHSSAAVTDVTIPFLSRFFAPPRCGVLCCWFA